MQIYPAYTVARIEEELSYREIEEISKFWAEHPSNYANMRLLKEMFAAFAGIKIDKSEKFTIENTIEQFRALGF